MLFLFLTFFCFYTTSRCVWNTYWRYCIGSRQTDFYWYRHENDFLSLSYGKHYVDTEPFKHHRNITSVYTALFNRNFPIEGYFSVSVLLSLLLSLMYYFQ